MRWRIQAIAASARRSTGYGRCVPRSCSRPSRGDGPREGRLQFVVAQIEGEESAHRPLEGLDVGLLLFRSPGPALLELSLIARIRALRFQLPDDGVDGRGRRPDAETHHAPPPLDLHDPVRPGFLDPARRGRVPGLQEGPFRWHLPPHAAAVDDRPLPGSGPDLERPLVLSRIRAGTIVRSVAGRAFEGRAGSRRRGLTRARVVVDGSEPCDGAVAGSGYHPG